MMNTYKYPILVRILAGICLLFVYVIDPIQMGVPLGYDSGIYIRMITDVGVSFDVGSLPGWIQRTFSPFFLSLVAVVNIFSLGDSIFAAYFLLYSGVLLCFFSIYFLGRTLGGKKAGILAVLFASSSLVLYNVFWWFYIKQLLAMGFLIVSCGLYQRFGPRYFLIGAFLAGLIHRPAILLAGILVILFLVFEKRKAHIYELSIGGIGAVLIGGSIYRPVLHDQILPVFVSFLDHIDLPTQQNSFQAGGTFLTLADYLRTNWIVAFFGVVGLGLSSREHTSTVTEKTIIIYVLLLFLRVIGQLMFFQRILGYVDIFLLVGVGVFASKIIKNYRWGVYLVALLRCIHTFISYMWFQSIKHPLVEKEEYLFIQQIDSIIEDNSVLLVPGVQYSPWLAGGSQADIVAPGLFDRNVWGTMEEEWQSKWFMASRDEKCRNIEDTYAVAGENLYIWLGSKQEMTDVFGGCFDLIKAHDRPFFALIKFNPKKKTGGKEQE